MLRTIGYDIDHIVDIAIAKRVTEAQARECDVSTEPDMTKIMQQGMNYIADEETTPENESVKQILMRRDSLSSHEADEIIEQARARVLDGEDPEEVCYDELGLEPDYVFEILGW